MKVTMFKATDGSLHATHEEYAKCEAEIKMVPQLEALIETGVGNSFAQDHDGTSCLYGEDIPHWVVDNAAALREILNGSVIKKRGRKHAPTT